MAAPIIDSHIHLYPESELDTLAWYTPDSPIGGQRSIEEYRAATSASSDRLKGFIFVETDRKNGPEGRDWADGPLAEVSWVSRIATGKPRSGEGHDAADAALCLAVVPWAPLPLGPEELGAYLARAEEAAGAETWALVKGFRYLLQDKPAGTGLGDGFVEALKVLGRKGYVFEVGVDQHRRGRTQLDECVEMIDRAHEGVAEEEKVGFVISKLGLISSLFFHPTLSPTFMFILVSLPGSYVRVLDDAVRSALLTHPKTISASPTSPSSTPPTRPSSPGEPPCSRSASAARPT